MTPILATQFKPANHFNQTQSKRWEYFKNLASIVCSRESTYRTALDITAFDIPVMFADAFRGYKKFLEVTFETMTGAMMIFIAPALTSIVGKLMGNFILPKEMRKDSIHYLKFSMDELRNQEKFETAAVRIEKE